MRFKDLFKTKPQEELPIKEVQCEQWKLPERFFPMDRVNFEFTDNWTKITVFGFDGNILHDEEYAPFQFDEVEEWLRDILITCNVIDK